VFLVGFIKVRTRVWNPFKPDDVREVEVLVDTGAIYSVLPSSLLKSMNVPVIGVRRFKLANNQVVEREVGVISVEVQGIRAHTLAVFGNEGVHLLGVTALEELGLEVDPIKGELRPMELLLM
jgi:clan AA aspartic protease